uniref:(northern house mosquito) hypothetical protein n=1 Tax=Culex pipiens TaxID=7175 RepID=A0A8D8E617_CULPI
MRRRSLRLLSKVVVRAWGKLLRRNLLTRIRLLRLMMVCWLVVLLHRRRLLVGVVRMMVSRLGRYKVPVALVQMRLLRWILLLLLLGLRLEEMICPHRLHHRLLLRCHRLRTLGSSGVSPIAPVVTPAIGIVVVGKCC